MTLRDAILICSVVLSATRAHAEQKIVRDFVVLLHSVSSKEEDTSVSIRLLVDGVEAATSDNIKESFATNTIHKFRLEAYGEGIRNDYSALPRGVTALFCFKPTHPQRWEFEWGFAFTWSDGTGSGNPISPPSIVLTEAEPCKQVPLTGPSPPKNEPSPKRGRAK